MNDDQGTNKALAVGNNPVGDRPAAPAAVVLPRRVLLLQCGRGRCGHVLSDDEREWRDRNDEFNSRVAVCPKCGCEEFYTLNALGQARRTGDTSPREIDPSDIQPSPRMGLKMKRRLLAAKRRLCEENHKFSGA